MTDASSELPISDTREWSRQRRLGAGTMRGARVIRHLANDARSRRIKRGGLIRSDLRTENFRADPRDARIVILLLVSYRE